jgi:hypothetical protein
MEPMAAYEHLLKSYVFTAALLAALAGCQTPSSRAKAPVPPPPAEPQVPVDASFDWHRLLIAPFGSVLKDVPAALHEVLLFRDEDPGAGAPDDAECYASDAPAPQFVAHTPYEYTLCFKQDRLRRIQASVRLAETDAAAVFAAACAGWLKNAAATRTTTGGAAPGADAPATEGADACEGRDIAVHFSAHLEREPEPVLSITLDGGAEP